MFLFCDYFDTFMFHVEASNVLLGRKSETARVWLLSRGSFPSDVVSLSDAIGSLKANPLKVGGLRRGAVKLIKRWLNLAR
jgi:hypothetical protein